MQANKTIRQDIYQAGLKHWQVADKIGIADTTLSVWLRKELDKEKKEKVEKAIKELSKSN